MRKLTLREFGKLPEVTLVVIDGAGIKPRSVTFQRQYFFQYTACSHIPEPSILFHLILAICQ